MTALARTTTRTTLLLLSFLPSFSAFVSTTTLSGKRHFVVTHADRFSAPEPVGELSILDCARPVMDAAKALEAAGTTICSFAGDDQATFYMGTQLVNTARDLEDAGALGRSRPGLFGDEAMLKLRASGEALAEAAKHLSVTALAEAGVELNTCGEALGRNSQKVSGQALALAGERLVAASLATRELEMPQQPVGGGGAGGRGASWAVPEELGGGEVVKGGESDSGSGGGGGFFSGLFGGGDGGGGGGAAAAEDEGPGFLAGMTQKMLGSGPRGTWDDVSDEIFKAGRELEKAGKVLETCRVAKRMAR